MKEKINKRQAVVVIHGMGEQRPLETLRGFMKAIDKLYRKTFGGKPTEVLYWDKPDTISDSYEARRMTLRSSRKTDITDFYEFYWAHHMRDTGFKHIKDWLMRLFFKQLRQIPKRLLKVWLTLWMLVVAFAVAVVTLLLTQGWNATGRLFTAIGASALFTYIISGLSEILFTYLGDAARYMDPSPYNIDERQKIRSEGVSFLRKLHECGKYERIVVVGHSLGSVVAYDLIKFLWTAYYKQFSPEAFETLLKSDDKDNILEEAYASEKSALNNEPIEEFRKAQQRSYDYLKKTGNPWLITDFVTMGSPLAHGGYLIAKNEEEFKYLKEQREYPTCPPLIPDVDDSTVLNSKYFDVPGFDHPIDVKHYNHSSPFAVTRWTNVYYTSDYIGGPLQPVFGKGIKDVEKPFKRSFYLYPGGHTEYWNEKLDSNGADELWLLLQKD